MHIVVHLKILARRARQRISFQEKVAENDWATFYDLNDASHFSDDWFRLYEERRSYAEIEKTYNIVRRHIQLTRITKEYREGCERDLVRIRSLNIPASELEPVKIALLTLASIENDIARVTTQLMRRLVRSMSLSIGSKPSEFDRSFIGGIYRDWLERSQGTLLAYVSQVSSAKCHIFWMERFSSEVTSIRRSWEFDLPFKILEMVLTFFDTVFRDESTGLMTDRDESNFMWSFLEDLKTFNESLTSAWSVAFSSSFCLYLEEHLSFQTGAKIDLQLLDPSRRIVHQGNLGSYVVLLDNYLLKVKLDDTGSEWILAVTERPLPVGLLRFTASAAASTRVRLGSGFSASDFSFEVGCLGRSDKHKFRARNSEHKDEWLSKLSQAKGASVINNAKCVPYKLTVLAGIGGGPNKGEDMSQIPLLDGTALHDAVQKSNSKFSYAHNLNREGIQITCLARSRLTDNSPVDVTIVSTKDRTLIIRPSQMDGVSAYHY